MTGTEWIETFRRIPPHEHGSLVIVLQNGTELNIDILHRFEQNFLVMRGRQGGTIDESRGFFVPYDQILILRLDRIVKMDELDALFGPSHQLAAAPEAPEVPVVQSKTPVVAPIDPAAASRLLLERIRAARARQAAAQNPRMNSSRGLK